MRIYIFSMPEDVFHPEMFYDILKEHATSVVGAAIFPKKNLIYKNIRKCLEIDGWKLFPRLIIRLFRLSGARPPCLPAHLHTVKDVFRHFGIQIDYFNNPNDLECVEKIKAIGANVIFNNQPVILKKDILSIPGAVFLNRHTSMLPDYRGVDPVFHALLDGKQKIGVSMHSMTTDIDAGNVYAQTTFTAEKSVFDCYSKAFRSSSGLFSAAIENLSKGVSLLTVDPKKTKCYKRPNKNEIYKFRKLGLKYL